jgi:hypothetical protein
VKGVAEHSKAATTVLIDKTRIDVEEVCRNCTANVIVIHGEQDRVIHVKDEYATIQALKCRT